MNRACRWPLWCSLVGLAVVAGFSIAGCPDLPGTPGGEQGPPGENGQPGPAGAAGLNAGDALPQTVVSIVRVNGDNTATAGSAFNVNFTVKDDSGNTIAISSLDRFSIYVSGPSDNYQRVIVPEGTTANIVTNTDGSYTYNFANPFPTTFAAPVNNSAALTAGEMTGQPITAGTYTVGIEARRSFTVEGASIRKAGDATLDFTVDGGALSPRQVVLQSNCENCHVQMKVHGDNRFKVTGCPLCHTAGAEDSISSDPAKATPGVTIKFSDMIHRLHRGEELPFVAATANGADPYRYEIIGFGASVNDFSDVVFPFMPGGTGFNEQTRNCQVCHGGASQASRIYTDANLTQENCTSCHDDMDFTTGTRLDPNNATVQAGTLTQAQLSDTAFRAAPGGIDHQLEDGSCTFCHSVGRSWAVDSVHVPWLSTPGNVIGLRVAIDSVGGASGGPGVFLPGDSLVIVFRLLDQNDAAVNISGVSVSFVLAGPVENYQKIIPGGSTSTLTVKGNGGVPTTGTGPFAYTCPTVIPATYPAPLNDSASFTFAAGWGELSGRALDAGSYTVLLYATRDTIVNGARFREASPPALKPIRIGTAGVAASYANLVTDAKCNACHGDLTFHGGGRKGVAECVMCHTGGSEDRATPASGTQAPEPDTVDFKVMVHKIHAARDLSVVTSGGKYDLVGFNNVLTDFSTGLLPSMAGEAKDCAACHATDAWKTPLERTDVNVWKVACTSCHDSTATATHVALNTLAGTPGTESCGVCHGEGRAFSVESSHAVP